MPNINLLKVVNKRLEERARNNDRDFSYFHASGWNYCRRKVAYEFYESQGIIKVAEDAHRINPQLQRIFHNGDYVHERWRAYLQEVPGALFGRWLCKNKWVHTEPQIYGEDDKLGCPLPEKCECGSTDFEYLEVGFSCQETSFGGHVDAIIDSTKWTYPPLNGKVPGDADRFVVVDFKSINPYSFKKLEEPEPAHRTQMQIYLYLSGLNLGKFLYESKGDQSVKEFLVERDEEFIQRRVKEAIELKHIVTHTNSAGKYVLPNKEYDDKDNKVCMQCKYRGHCWKTPKR